MYYVIPDLHGHSLILKQVLKYLKERSPQGGKIIFLGDYIDRGPDPLGVIELVRNPPEGWEFVLLKGNHEDMLYESFTKGYQPYCPTISNLYLSSDEKQDIVDWILSLKQYHIEDGNIFVHAGIDETLPIDQQSEGFMLWVRGSPEFEYSSDEIFVTHGHTPHKGLEMTRNRLNLDQGYHFYKELAVATFEENVLGPIEVNVFTLNNECEIKVEQSYSSLT